MSSRLALLLVAAVMATAACTAEASPRETAPSATTVTTGREAGPVRGHQLSYAAQSALSSARTVRFTSTIETATGPSVTTGHAALTGTELGLQLASDGVEVVRPHPLRLWARIDGGAWSQPDEPGSGWDPLSLALIEVVVAHVDQANQARALAAFDEFDLVGVEDVGGTSARRYAGTTDKPAYVATQRPLTGVHLSLSEAEPITVEVWVDDADRIVRFSQTTTDAAGADLTFVTDYTDYGAAVTVSPPE